MEALNREVINALMEKALTDHYLQRSIDIVDTFFYLDSLNIGDSTTNPEILRAWQLAWQKVEENLKGIGLVIVHKAGDVFDPSIHEAIERQSAGGQPTIIKAVVQERLSELFRQDILHTVDPDLCVALGASVQCGLICGEPLGPILIDVAAHSLGVKTADWFNDNGEADYFSPIIKRNTTVPVEKAQVYYTIVDNQKAVNVEVYQGESHYCSKIHWLEISPLI